MKKDYWLIIGGVALVAAIFLAAFKFYKSSSLDASHPASNQSGRIETSVLVKDWSPSLGPSMARVVVVEFLDPECESCRAMHPIVKRTLARFGDRVRYVVRYMPFHGNSELAARWLEAAREQGKYWEALDALFEKQPEWGSHHMPRPDLIPKILKDAGVNIEQAEQAKENPEYARRVQRDKEDGLLALVNGTPTFFVNGRRLEMLGEQPLVDLIESELEGSGL